MERYSTSVTQTVGEVHNGKVIGTQVNNQFIVNIDPEFMRSLLEIFSNKGIDKKIWKPSYKANIPELFKKKFKDTELLTILEVLFDIPPQLDNSLPLLSFLQGFVDRIKDNEVADKLGKWINKVALEQAKNSNFNIAKKPVEIITDDQILKNAHLFIELIPDPNNQNKGQELFVIRMYLWKNSNDVQCRYTSERPCEIGGINKIIDHFIATEFDELDELQTIEFFMPCGFIFLEVDQWRIEEGILTTKTFGQEYHIFIRLNRNRQYRDGKMITIHPVSRRKWKKKWDFLQTKGKAYHDLTFFSKFLQVVT